jgi:hypothetical protein
MKQTQNPVRSAVHDYMAKLARKSHAARRGTEKARAHAAAISAKGVAARRRKAQERKAEQADNA